MGKEIVRYQNNFIEAQYCFSLLEKKIMTGICNQIQNLRIVDDRRFETIFQFSAKEISELVGIDDEPKQIRKSIESLMQKIITCRDLDGTIIKFPLLTIAKYHMNGVIDVGLRKEMVQFIKIKLEEGNWTPYHLENIRPLRSTYSIRIYELLKEHEKQKNRQCEYTIDDLKKKLGISPDEHKLYGNFKQHVIEQAKKDLKAKTDLNFTYKEEKLGRSVYKLIFKIQPNTAERERRKKEREEKQKQKKIEKQRAEYQAALEASQMSLIDAANLIDPIEAIAEFEKRGI